MNPHVSFILVERRSRPSGPAAEIRQDLPAEEIEVHTIPVGQGPVELPTARGQVVVILDADVSPERDLARQVTDTFRHLPTPRRTVLLGRVIPDPDAIRDPVAREIVTGRWGRPAHTREPLPVGLHRFHGRCLALPRELYDAARDAMGGFLGTAEPSAILLGYRLLQEHDAELRLEPRIAARRRVAISLEDAIAETRREGRMALEIALRTPELRRELSIPSREAILDAAPDTLEERLDRLRRVADQLAGLDLPALEEAEMADVPVVNPITTLTETLFEGIWEAARWLGWIERAQSDTPLIDDPAVGRARPIPTEEAGAPTLEAPAEAAAPEDVPAKAPCPDLSIVIVTRNDAGPLELALAAIEAHTPESHEVILVDNASTDGTADRFGARPDVRTVVPFTEARGYAEAASAGARVATGTNIVFLTPDAVVTRGWSSALLGALGEDVGAIAPVSNGLLGRQSVHRWVSGRATVGSIEALQAALAGLEEREQPTRLLQPLCVLVPRDRLEEVGLLDARFRLPHGAFMALSRSLHERGLRMRVATAALVLRKNGTDGARPASHQAEANAMDMRELGRLLSTPGADAPPSAREVWGSDWTGYDEINAVPEAPVSVVIPVRNQLEYTRQCLDSLQKSSLRGLEIILVDNGSTDGTPEYLARRDDVTVLRNEENQGFARAVNRGLDASRSRMVIVLNNDVVVPRRTLERLVTVLENEPSYGVIGPVSNCCAQTQQIEVGYRDLDGLEAFSDARWREHGARLRPEPVVLGLCMAIRREVLETIGGFDERFEIGNFEDNDISLRASVAGYRLGVAEGVFIHHYGSRTFVGEGFDYAELLRANHERFLAKWRGVADAPVPVAGAPSAADAAGDTDTVGAPGAAGPGASPFPATDVDPALATSSDAGSGTDAGWIPVDSDEDDEIDAEDYEPTAGDLYVIANARFEAEAFEEAITYFDWALELMPEMILAHMGKGLALARMGRTEQAIPCLERAVELEPTFSEGFNNLGVAHHLAGHADEAREALLTAIELDPDNVEARENLEAITEAARAS